MSQPIRDYAKLALDIIRLVGGKDNIQSAARCATRLRLVLKETPANAENEIKGLPGVITVVQKQGQFQVVIGNHVGDVFDVVSKEVNIDEASAVENAGKESLLNRILQTMSGVFAPICYVLAAAGILQGILIIITMIAPGVSESGTYQIFNLLSWAPFTFLPVLIAITASKHFKCNTFVAVVCCLALVSPTWGEIAAKIADGESLKFLFINLTEITYTSSVLPPLILVALMAPLERFLNRNLPDLIKPLFTPFLCMAIMVPLTIVMIGPIIQGASNGIAAGYNILYAMAPPIAGAVVGGLWEIIVVFGIQWGMVPIVLANFAQNGYDTIQIFIQIAVIAQMAAAFGVFLKTRDKELKTTSLSAGITAIFGITEPSIYGVTLPRKKPFVYASVWAAAGSIVAAVIGAKQYVYAGLPGLVSTINSMSADNPRSFIGCMAGAGVAVVGTIVTIMIFGYETKSSVEIDDMEEECSATQSHGEIVDKNVSEAGMVYSPLNGELRMLSQVNDPTFSEEVLGKGIAIYPSEGKLYAPFDGKVSSLFDTKHAIGLTDSTGIELLVHIGLETVDLAGKYFEAKVGTDDLVRKGDLLIEFDLEKIKENFDTITPVIITNSDDFSEIIVEKTEGKILTGEQILTVKK